MGWSVGGTWRPEGSPEKRPIPARCPPCFYGRVATEIEELARGYSEAFARISRTPVYLNLRKDGVTVTLVSVRAVRPFAGVVVIELDNGFTYILNPEDIVSITDAPPPKVTRP